MRRKSQTGRESTIADVIEAVEATAPETKDQLADEVNLSIHYLSEIVQDLKADGMVKKAYVVDKEAVYDAAENVSELWDEGDAETTGPELLALLRRLDDVTFDQYRAARTAFEGGEPERTAAQLESLSNERYGTVLGELRSYTLTTDWPSNRIAADIAAIAKNLEIVGDRACFISDTIAGDDTEPGGTVRDRAIGIFEAGEEIHDHVVAILFQCDLERIDVLHATEKAIHRELSELFELATAYNPDVYGYLVAVSRTLERIIHYWVTVGEHAVRLHGGVDPGHVEV
jgi:phosphate transport system protein